MLQALRDRAVPDQVEGRSVECKVDASRNYRHQHPTAVGNPRDEGVAATLADAAACIANSGGGLVVLGVEDRTGRFDHTVADEEWLLERVADLTRPPLRCRAHVGHEAGNRYVVLDVPTAGDEPHSAPDSRPKGRGRRTTIRDGRRCVELTFTNWARHQELRRLAEADWSSVPSASGPVDVDPAVRQRVADLMSRSRDEVVRRHARDPFDDAARVLGVVASSGRLNRAGHLLLVDGASAEVEYRYMSTPGGLPEARIEGGHLPLLHVLDEIESAMEARNPRHPGLTGFVADDVRALPLETLREAVVNAVAHRDYERRGPGIVIDHHPDELLVASTGPLLASVEGRVLSTSVRRNETLAIVLRRLGFADLVGRGVDAMYREALRRGHPRPSITSVADATRCHVLGGPPDTVVVEALLEVEPTQQLTAEPLLAIDELRASPWISAAALSGPLGRPVDEVSAKIRRWVGEFRVRDDDVFGLVESAGRVGLTLSRSMQERLEPRLTWRPPRREDAVDILVDFASWKGRIARRDVARLYGIADVTASGWLSSLVEEGHLEVGVAAGRHAHYLAPTST